MPRSFEFFFDFTSPTSYLALPLALGVEARTGAELVFRPLFLGGVMQATGNRPPGSVPAKATYLGRDLVRCAAHIGVPFHMNPAFPMNTLAVLRGTLGMPDEEDRRRIIRALFRAAWGEPHPADLGDPAAVTAILSTVGIDADAFAAAATNPANKHALKASTEEAVARGVFGAPSFFVADDLFFGHDRLDYVERALTS